jgi:hypothetical protein
MIRLEIVNDGSGTKEVANYSVYLYLPETNPGGLLFREYFVRVESFPRSQGWAALVERAVALLDPLVPSA